MADRDKVISRLQIIRTWADVGPSIEGRCLEDIVAWIDDALALLKEQEPDFCKDTNKARIFSCSKCGYKCEDIFIDEENFEFPAINFCPNCGRAVKWE